MFTLNCFVNNKILESLVIIIISAALFGAETLKDPPINRFCFFPQELEIFSKSYF